ncbi:MAG: protein rep [Acidobacteria bacterium]|nr:protein rep [Acidobacteriota bacterium]
MEPEASSPGKTRGKAGPPVTPSELAADLEASIRTDHERRVLVPHQREPQTALARWGRALGLEAELGLPKGARLDWERLADLVAQRISLDPERFTELAAQAQAFEAYLLRREARTLESCGTPWGRVVRLFWRDRKGRLVMRQRGLHACKHRWCPRCGRSRQNRLASDIERCFELAKEWGFRDQNYRFLTLTIRNGQDVSALRKEAHKAWAKLQRTRWWPRHVFGWFRGTEVVTGQDGSWNLHLHIVLVLWANQVTRGSKTMQFVTLEDETGLVEAVAFPDAFQRRGSAYSVGEIVPVSGTADLQDGVGILRLK